MFVPLSSPWAFLAILASSLIPAVIAACSRDELLLTVGQFLLGLTMGQAGPLENIADDFQYVENNKPTVIVSGIFNNILKIDFNRTIIDMTTCSTFTEVVSAISFKPFVLGAQIRHSPSDNSVYKIDTIVSTTGSWLFNASRTLQYARQENWPVIPSAQRDTRQTLQAAADAYLDMWSNKSAIDAVPWGTPCARLEGSVYTGKGAPDDSCKVGIPSNNTQPPNSDRRYVIDESMGTVSVLCNFEHLGNAADSHEFRLEGGKLRYIHTITVADSSAWEREVGLSARL
ncbi:hypothetical protein B0H65DRAFT_440914 [Neurospora tetraspora]|uniref:DUF8021 domain-containing protein n=1 Tax=Neurospora tetraspora TaxID=94610 RepID=A0AAE0MV30_9PEZI|nr:hypothetical protein B0H65DRAFT_440914 [Neurospora tetraspora]